MDDPKYQRLTRARPRARFSIISTGNSCLWLGPDHLLCIDSNSFNETYKRFYFRDIQALIIRKTDRYKYAALTLGVFGGFFAVLAGVAGGAIGRTVWLSIAGFVWFIMLLNLAFGPTSVCCLQTAVQIEELPSLNRLRRARKVLNRLRPLIAAAQGELKPDEIGPRLQGLQPQSQGMPVFTTPESAPQAAAQPNYVVDDPNAPPRIIS